MQGGAPNSRGGMGQQGGPSVWERGENKPTSAGRGPRGMPVPISEYGVLRALSTMQLSWAGFRVKILPWQNY